jgi:hypothetical protein
VATTAASQPAAGKITTAEGQVIDAGAAGKDTVGKDGEVRYNKPLVFTKDNIDAVTTDGRAGRRRSETAGMVDVRAALRLERWRHPHGPLQSSTG